MTTLTILTACVTLSATMLHGPQADSWLVWFDGHTRLYGSSLPWCEEPGYSKDIVLVPVWKHKPYTTLPSPIVRVCFAHGSVDYDCDGVIGWGDWGQMQLLPEFKALTASEKLDWQGALLAQWGKEWAS